MYAIWESFHLKQIKWDFFPKDQFYSQRTLVAEVQNLLLKQARKGVIAMIKITECCIPKDKDHTDNLV